MLNDPGPGVQAGGLLGGGDFETVMKMSKKGRRRLSNGREVMCRYVGAGGFMQRIMKY